MANKFKRFNKTNEEIIVKSENVEGLSSLLGNKVSVVTGKQLSTNDFTNTDKSNVSANTSARHTHSNKSIIDKITQAFIDNWTAAYTHISDTVKHITAAERTNWNGAATSQHTHSNKSVLDGITSTLVSNWNSAYTHISDAIKHITATERTNWNSAKSKADAALPARISLHWLWNPSRHRMRKLKYEILFSKTHQGRDCILHLSPFCPALHACREAG